MVYEEIVNRLISVVESHGVFITHKSYGGWYAKFVSYGQEISKSGPCQTEKAAIALCAIVAIEEGELTL